MFIFHFYAFNGVIISGSLTYNIYSSIYQYYQPIQIIQRYDEQKFFVSQETCKYITKRVINTLKTLSLNPFRYYEMFSQICPCGGIFSSSHCLYTGYGNTGSFPPTSRQCELEQEGILVRVLCFILLKLLRNKMGSVAVEDTTCSDDGHKYFWVSEKTE